MCNSTRYPCTLQTISTRYQKRHYSYWNSNNGNGLQKVLNSAEKLVGYPTSYSSLKYLVDEEEPSNFIGLAKKLVGSGHPLLKTARDLLSQDPYSSYQLGGLWVLLISKASNKATLLDEDLVHGIHQKQRSLAETTELINTGNYLKCCFLKGKLWFILGTGGWESQGWEVGW